MGERSFKDIPCAVCGTSVVAKDFVLCATCEVPTHRDCWEMIGKCPAYACSGTEPVEPAVALFRRQITEAHGETALTIENVSSGTRTPAERRELLARVERRMSKIEGTIWPMVVGALIGLPVAFLGIYIDLVPLVLGGFVWVIGGFLLMAWLSSSLQEELQDLKAIRSQLRTEERLEEDAPGEKRR